MMLSADNATAFSTSCFVTSNTIRQKLTRLKKQNISNSHFAYLRNGLAINDSSLKDAY